MDVTSCFADTAPTFNSGAGQAKDFDPTGWELALVTTPSSNISSVNERQLVGLLMTFYILLSPSLANGYCASNPHCHGKCVGTIT